MEDLVIEVSNDFKRIIPTSEIKEKYRELYWGGNGIGDRWANKKFNYTVIYTKKNRLYSENSEDVIPKEVLDEFLKNIYSKIGIWPLNQSNNILLILLILLLIIKDVNNVISWKKQDVLLGLHFIKCIEDSL